METRFIWRDNCLKTLPAPSIEEQTQSILNQVESLLTEAGTTKENILSATIWLTDMADFAVINSVWDEWLPRDTPQAGHALSRLNWRLIISM